MPPHLQGVDANHRATPEEQRRQSSRLLPPARGIRRGRLRLCLGEHLNARPPAQDGQPTSGRRSAMSKYRSVVVAVLAAATMLVAAQAAEARVVAKRESASTFVAGSGHASGARPTGCYVAPCPSPKPQRECDVVDYSGSTWVVAE